MQFFKEYNLTEKPLQIDTLVLKLEPDCEVTKSIERKFRRHNIIEYKSPGDYISVNDYYKVLGYTCFYQSATEAVMEDIQVLAEAYKGKEKQPQYEAVMDLIIRANYQQTEEGKEMCEALRELFADELQEREEKGLSQGIADSILQLLADVGPVPDELSDIILSQNSQDILRQWLKAAAKVSSIEEFEKKVNEEMTIC